MSEWEDRAKATAPRLIHCADGNWLAVSPPGALKCGAWGESKIEARKAYADAMWRIRRILAGSL